MKKIYSERELKQGYKLYTEMYKKQNKREKMFDKMQTEYQWRMNVVASDKSMAAVSKELISRDKFKYTWSEGLRKYKIMARNKRWLEENNLRPNDINIDDVRRGKWDDRIDALLDRMKKDRVNNHISISQYYYGS